MKCAAYVRISYKEHSKYSLSIQVKAIEEYIDNQNWQLCKIYKDENSLGPGLNVGLQRAIKDAKEEQIEVIISMTATRLFRYYEQAIPLQDLCQQQMVNIITLDNCVNTFEGKYGLIHSPLFMINLDISK
ncbi:recombinase family protein [Ornithinibacillus sp. JPR2-1]|uniref:recombinase family protein n=1 Tax=Ornithinibacillus sp. JPR2-1 TaxID=2094019 RepID=UPI0031D3067A